jgi:ATP/ADP translocase
MLRLLKRVAPLHQEERAAVATLFLHYFLVSASVIAGKSARDALFLSHFSKSVLPLMYVANAVIITAAMALLSRISRRFGTREVATGSLVVFAVSLLAILFRLTGFVIAALYIWMEVIGAVALMQAWIMVGNAFDPRQAKRLFGVIAAGGSIAASAGGFAVAILATRYGATFLIGIVAGVLGFAALTAWFASGFEAPRPKRRPSPEIAKPGALSPYTISIATLVVASSVVSALVQYRFQVGAADAYPQRSELLTFFGQFYAWSGAASLITQLFLSSLLLSRFGLTSGLAVLPICFSIGSALTLTFPALWSVGFSRFCDLTFKFTLNNSAVEMLWLPVPADQRRIVKPLIGGTFKAVSEAGAGLSMFLLVNVAPAWVLSGLALGACGIWLLTVVRLNRQYRSALAAVIAKRQLSSDALRIDPRDPSVAASLEHALQSGDEVEQISALTFLEGFPVSHWATTLQRLYREGSPEIREAILRVAADDRKVIPDEWIVASLREGVAHAARVAIDRKIGPAKPLVLELLRSNDVRMSIAAAAALLREGGHAEAQSRIEEWLDSPNTRTAAQALGALPPDIARVDPVRLRRWLTGSDSAAARAALRVAAFTRDKRILDAVIACLARPPCALRARATLRQFDEAAVLRLLIETVTGESVDERLRRGALQGLREYAEIVPEERVGSRVSLRFLRTYEEFAALLQAIRRVRPLERSIAERAAQDLRDAVDRGCETHAIRLQLASDPDAILLRDYAEQQCSTAVDIGLRLAASINESFPADACLRVTHSGDRAGIPYVLELADTSLPREHARLLIRLIEAAQYQAPRDNRERFETHPLEAAKRLERSAEESDEWAQAVTRHYFARKSSGSLDGDVLMYSTLEKTIYLKSSDVFGGIAAENLSRLAGIAVEASWPSGSVVFREGDAGDALYLVLSGSVRIVKEGVEINTLRKGACFGEMAVLDGAPRSADATVSDEAVLLRISSEEFYEALAEDPRLMQNVIAVLTGRLRDANARIVRTNVI